MVIDSFLGAECLLMATESWKHNNRLQDPIHLLKSASLRRGLGESFGAD